MTTVSETREVFANRRDRLVERTRHPLQSKVIEAFLPGRPGALRAITEVAGVSRVVDFYAGARTDGLVRREEQLNEKVVDLFVSRADGMHYRSCTLHEERDAKSRSSQVAVLPSGGISGGDFDLVAHKLAVKFTKQPQRPMDPSSSSSSEKGPTVKGPVCSLSKRSFYLREGRLRTQYHLGPGRVTCDEEHHYKEKGLTPEAARLQGEFKLADALAAERSCLSEVKRSHGEMIELLKQRRREEEAVVVDEPIFDAAPKLHLRGKLGLDPSGSGGLRGKGTNSGSGSSLEKDGGPAVDYLTPFLQGTAMSANEHKPTSPPSSPSSSERVRELGKEEAQRARDGCLRSLKERLLERANIIQNRLNDENAKLAKKQATFQRNAARDADPHMALEFERFCADAMFTIGILEQRLVSHEESALKKYQHLDEKLSADPRLAALLI